MIDYFAGVTTMPLLGEYVPSDVKRIYDCSKESYEMTDDEYKLYKKQAEFAFRPEGVKEKKKK